ncbi:MAG: hypothetical protein JW778_05640 [Candidatus Altiarchaeota archaeon]|nr:hypothetical protein [Candidatus Altiarchaeota archaeon]
MKQTCFSSLLFLVLILCTTVVAQETVTSSCNCLITQLLEVLTGAVILLSSAFVVWHLLSFYVNRKKGVAGGTSLLKKLFLYLLITFFVTLIVFGIVGIYIGIGIVLLVVVIHLVLMFISALIPLILPIIFVFIISLLVHRFMGEKASKIMSPFLMTAFLPQLMFTYILLLSWAVTGEPSPSLIGLSLTPALIQFLILRIMLKRNTENKPVSHLMAVASLIPVITGLILINSGIFECVCL